MPVDKIANTFKTFDRASAANLIVRLNIAKLEQFIKSRAATVKTKTKDEMILKLLKEYIQSPEHQELKKALVDSHYFNGGDYSPLINELRNGL